MKKKKVSIVGTNGIPAKYGGFETLAEHLTAKLSNDFDFTVYCSSSHKRELKGYNNSKLVYLPLKANGWQSILYDAITLFIASIKTDVILYLGPGAGYFLPLIRLFNKNIIVNHGGLNEWEREKYTSFQRFIAKLGHKYGAKSAKYNIADNFLLRNSIIEVFGEESYVIRYGGDHAMEAKITDEIKLKYPFITGPYFINVSRAQIDNNLHIVLKAFENQPEHNLVIISNWDVSNYGIKLRKLYKNKFKNIIVLDAIYEPNEINSLRANASVYIHSHSYCGTSPSLVEAMSLGLAIYSFDVPTNRETTKNKALFFDDSESLKQLIYTTNNEDIKSCGKEMKIIAKKNYTWDIISDQYAKLLEN